MTRSRTMISGLASTALLSASMVMATGAAAGAATVDPKFCEGMLEATQAQMVAALIGGFAEGFGGEEAAEDGELTGAQVTAVIRLIVSPRAGIGYTNAAKHAPKQLKGPLAKIGKYMTSAEKVLKKGGVSNAEIKKLRSFDLTKAAITEDESLSSLTGDKLSEAQQLKLAKAAEAWQAEGQKQFESIGQDEKLNEAMDNAIGACAPTNGAGKPVSDACKLLTPAMIEVVPDATTDDAEGEDEFPLSRSCTLSVGTGNLTVSVTTPRQMSAIMKTLEDATKFKGVGSSAVITDGFGTASFSNMSVSTEGKTIWVTSKKTAFSLSLSKVDPESYETLEVTDKEITELAKLMAKQLKI